MKERRRDFEARVLPHLDAAYNLARWLARGDADDIVQDAMLRAYRGFAGFQGGDARPWLLAIVRNCWRSAYADRMRRGHAPLPDDDGAAIVSDLSDPEASAAAASDRRRLDVLIAALPDEFREVLILRELEDMNYRDIAEVTGSPIGTVMSRLARARALIRARWTAGDNP